MKKTLALFDFDGTITSKDTLFEIAKFSTSPVKYWFKIILLLPTFLMMKLGVLTKHKGKEIFLGYFFNKYNLDSFNLLCTRFCRDKLPSLIRPKALDKIQNLQKNSDIYIVSASPENWIIPWAQSQKIAVLSTQLDFSNQHFSGKIKNKNINYDEKANLIKQKIKLDDYEEIIAFGDTKGDLPMFKLATKSYYKPFE